MDETKASCAHLTVTWRTEIVEDGAADIHGEPTRATRGWWECASDCGTKFAPTARRGLERMAVADADSGEIVTFRDGAPESIGPLCVESYQHAPVILATVPNAPLMKVVYVPVAVSLEEVEMNTEAAQLRDLCDLKLSFAQPLLIAGIERLRKPSRW